VLGVLGVLRVLAEIDSCEARGALKKVRAAEGSFAFLFEESAGTRRALSWGMKPVTKHTELIAWQLCSRLRALVLQHTRHGEVAREYDYRRQLRRAVRSACYLTSEGFYRYRRKSMSCYIDWAKASLGEALDQLDEGLEQKYFTPAAHLEMRRICLRGIKCNRALKRSWGDSLAPGEPGQRSKERRPTVSELRRQARQHPEHPEHPKHP
jgi:four helix bundle protein